MSKASIRPLLLSCLPPESDEGTHNNSASARVLIGASNLIVVPTLRDFQTKCNADFGTRTRYSYLGRLELPDAITSVITQKRPLVIT